MEACISESATSENKNPEVSACAILLDKSFPISSDVAQSYEKLEDISLSSTQQKEETPQLELKPLPKDLRYVFLGPNSTYPVIINANLSESQSYALLAELR